MSTFLEANRAAAEGERDRVQELLRASPPSSDRERQQWTLLMVEICDLAAARELVSTIRDAAIRAELEPLLDATPDGGLTEASGAMDWEPEALPSPARPTDDAATLERFARWFGGRRDLYAQQWYSRERRRGGYRPVREPLTHDVIRSHLSGRRTIGQYLLDSRGRVTFAVLDLDVDADALADMQMRTGKDEPLRHPPLLDYLKKVLDSAARLGIPMFPAASGGRGAHAWMFFDGPRPASSARSLLQQILSLAGPPPSTLSVEAFPKQEALGPRGLSSLVKLPLGLHQRTLRPAALLDDDLRPIEDPKAAMERLEAVPDATVDALVGRRVVPLPAPEGLPKERLPILPVTHQSTQLGPALAQISAGSEERAAADLILDRCAVLNAIVRSAFESRALPPDEARAITYSLGLISSDPSRARETLIAAGSTLKELDRVRKGTASPVGCRKLQRLRPGVTCRGCPSGEAALPYPSPCSAAVSVEPFAPPRHAQFSAYLMPDEQVVQTAQEKLLEKLERLERRLVELEGETPE